MHILGGIPAAVNTSGVVTQQHIPVTNTLRQVELEDNRCLGALANNARYLFSMDTSMVMTHANRVRHTISCV